MNDNSRASAPSSGKRDRALDGVKGIAILLVMVGHCIVLNGLDQYDPWLYDAIRSIQMPLFMLISGIAAAKSIFTLEKLKKRAIAYLVPFFSWFVISYFWARIRAFIKKEPVLLSPGNFLGELRDLLFQTDRGLWFLMTLFVITVVMTLAFLLAEKLLKKGEQDKGRTALMLFLILCFYVLFILQARSGFLLLSPALTVSYLPYYCLGYFGARLLSALQKPLPVRAKAAACVLLLIGFLFLVMAYDLTKPVEGIMDLAVSQAASLSGTLSVFGLFYLLFDRRKKTDPGPIAGFFAFAGRYTLEIYVLHFRFARLLGIGGKVSALYSPTGLFWLLATLLLMSVLTAGCIFLLKKAALSDLLLFGKIKGK